jgi:acyl-CoA-binding protein
MFDDAVKYINGLPKESPVPGVQLTSSEERLGYYALYKVASVGKVPDSNKRPGMFDKQGQFKYDAWKAQENFTSEEAKAMYVDVVAMGMLIDAKERPEVFQWLNDMLSQDDCPAFVKAVLDSDRDKWPRIWKLAEELATAIEDAKDSGKEESLTGLRWQAVYGDVYVSKPGMLGLGGFKLSGSQWQSWSDAKGAKKDEAMKSYIEKAK